MKRTILMVVMLASAVALFANGARETDREPVWNPVEVTGTVSVVDGYIVLDADGTTYLLGAPRAAWYVDELEEGQTITIRGQLIEDPVAEVELDVDAHIRVDQAVVDGEAYRIGQMGFMPGPSRMAGPRMAERPYGGLDGERPFGAFREEERVPMREDGVWCGREDFGRGRMPGGRRQPGQASRW